MFRSDFSLRSRASFFFLRLTGLYTSSLLIIVTEIDITSPPHRVDMSPQIPREDEQSKFFTLSAWKFATVNPTVFVKF